MPNYPGDSSRRRGALERLAGGLHTSRHPLLIAPTQTPDCRNVDFNDDSVKSSGGALKLGNRPAPGPGVLFKPDAALAALSTEAGRSVPARGWGMLRYDDDYDLGGNEDFFDNGAGFTADSFHERIGRSFDLNVSFRLPEDVKLHAKLDGAQSGPTQYSTLSGADQADVDELDALGGYDEAMEECICIIQKGGDRLSPMSWFLGIVNTGEKFEYVTGGATTPRPSNYALVFGWLDAPQWGGHAPGHMRYRTGSGGANVGTAGTYSTLAYRTVLAEAWIEPGREYSVSVNLGLDTGSPGTGADPTAAWNSDGTFSIVVVDDADGATVCSVANGNLFVIRGPADSVEYLNRYGIRYHGRDAMFLGLGYRFANDQGAGWIPCGLDSASLEHGGFRMVDVSEEAEPAIYASGGGTPLTCSHVASSADVTMNQLGLVDGGHAADGNPLDPVQSNTWLGLGGGTGAGYHPNGMIGYWGVLWNTADPVLNGLRWRMGSYTEPSSVGTFGADLSTATKAWTAEPFFPICFRWHQRPLVVSEVRIWRAPRDYTDGRVLFSLRSQTIMSDETESDLADLEARWPLDDGGGYVLRETVAGRTGFLGPFGLGQPAEGGVFLSGEGEAIKLKLADNPVFEREFRHLLQKGTGGFALELEVEFLEAFYARDETDGTTRTGRYAPHIASWEVEENDAKAGFRNPVQPLLRLTFRSELPNVVGSEPFYYPAGFSVMSALLDDEASVLEPVLLPWTAASPPLPNYSKDAIWVGKKIRVQMGVESTGTANQFRVYIALTPKADIFPEDGDPGAAEFAYFETKTISRKQLVRSAIVIGGAWQAESLGYTELNCRMLVHQARVFCTAAPGKLPATTGAVNVARDGKLVSDRALPERVLTSADLLQPVSASVGGVNVTDRSNTVTPSDGSRFFLEEPEDTLNAVKEGFLLVSGDGFEVRLPEQLPSEQEEFYYVESVAADGSSLTLTTPFDGQDRKGAYARILRLCGYSAFQDDIEDLRLAIAKGTAFVPGTSTSEDAQQTQQYFANLAGMTGAFIIRVYSSQFGAADVLPQWVRGCAVTRREEITGLFSLDDKRFGSTLGSVFEFDDRWREEGPTEVLLRSLAFRGRLDPRSDVVYPLHKDWVEYPQASAAAADITLMDLDGAKVRYDAWVKLDALGAFQTILWSGDPGTNPQLVAGAAAHIVNTWVRLNRGYPELVYGSTGTYDGTNRPEKGLFVARGVTPLEVGVWAHLRWEVEGANSGFELGYLPCCYINGRPVTVRTNAIQNGLGSTGWIGKGAIVPVGSGGRLLLGVARDSYVSPEQGEAFVDANLGGVALRADRVSGHVHGLMGSLADVVVELV